MKRKALMSLILLLCLSTIYPFTVLADSTPVFTLAISNAKPELNKEITVTVDGKQLNDLYAFELNLSFQSTHLKFVKADSSSTGFSITPIVKGDSLQLAHTLIGNKPGINGEARLVTITLETIANGSADIKLTSLKLVNSKLEAVTVNGSAAVIATIGSSGSNPTSTPTMTPTPAPTTVLEKEGSIIVLRPKVKVDDKSHTVESMIDVDIWNEALKSVKSDLNGSKKIKIVIPETKEALDYVQHLPAGSLSGNIDLIQVEVATPFANLVLSSNMFKGRELPAGDLTLHIGQADTSQFDYALKQRIGNHPVLDIQFLVGDQKIEWNNPDAPVMFIMPYSPTAAELKDPEHIVVWYVDSQGKVNPVVSGTYNPATGTVSFTTTHFSIYSIAYVQTKFSDIASYEWARKPIEVMASKGIIKGVSESKFSPAKSITRADFVMLLVRTLGLTSNIEGKRFLDVQPGAYYDEPLQIAQALGIAQGDSTLRFKPQDPITREDMMVLTSRALQAAKKPIASKADLSAWNGYMDVSSISSYALNDVAELIKAGLVHGSNNSIHPQATATRAESAVLMYNLYNYFYS